MLKKALIINPYWDTFGGGERYVGSVVKLLLNLGWEVDIQWPKDISAELFSKFSLDISGAKYVGPNVYTSRYRLAFYASDGSLPLSFSRLTLIHFQFPFTHVNGTSLPNFLKSRTYKFICNSHFTKSFIDKEFSVNSEVVYPPVGTAKFYPAKKTKTILYVGRFSQLTQLKNQAVLIESFKRISKQIKSWKLILAGGIGIGSDADYMQSLNSAAHGFPIEILPNPSFSQLQKLYSHASIFWSASGFGANESTDPTKVEHFGISLVESMAAGCVPIVSNLGGHKEIVENAKNGYLVNSPAEMEQKTLELLSDPKQLSLLAKQAMIKSKTYDIENFNLCLKKYLS